MKESSNPPAPHLDKLGKLCHDGLDIARYLFQVPDDEGEKERVRQILTSILAEPGVKMRREFPRIAEEMQQALSGEPTPMTAELLQEGFERLIKLSQAARSGLM